MIEQENNKKINKQKKDWIEIVFEVIALTLIATVVFIGGIYLLVRVIGRFIPFWFSGLMGPLLILGFDTLWVIGIRKWRPKSNQLKVLKKIVSVTVLAFSASVLVLWCIGYIFRDVW
jgi:hypothetical protein